MPMFSRVLDTVLKKGNSLLEHKWIVAGVLIFLFALTFVPRLYKIDNPVADWHSWRQADTAAVTRNFVKEGFTPLFPKFDSLNSLNEGNLPNPNRYFFAEFPIYNSIVYIFYSLFGVNEVYARLVSIFFASLTTVFLYLLTRKFSSNMVALMAAVFFALMPYNIYYGRVIMPDPLHIFFSVITLYLVAQWAERKTMLWAVLAGLTTAGMILTKPYGLVLGLPILYLLWRGYGWKLIKQPSLYVYGALALIPFALWRWHIHQYPEGMFGTAWLFNQGNIRFTGAYFRWLIFDRMNRLMFATGGFVLFWLGLMKGYTKKEGLFYYIWLGSVVLFFVVIAKGNVTHDYYQMPLVPIGCILMAQGVVFLLEFGKGEFTRLVNTGIAGALVLLMLAFGWYEVRAFFNINRPEIVEAGRFIDQNLPADARVIAPYMSDPAFLYQTNRYGWTIGGGQIQTFIEKEGATHLAIVNFDQDEQLWLDRCPVVGQSEGRWAVLDLKQCAPMQEEATGEADLMEMPVQP